MKWNEKFKSEKWNISCHINKQGCHNHQQFQPFSVNYWVLRAFRNEKNTCYLCASQLLSRVQLFLNPRTVDWQAPLSMEFSTQEYRNGLPFPSPTCYLIASRLQPIPMVSPKGAQNVKNIGYWPQDNWDAYERNDFSKLRLWLLPLHRKVLNSLTWDIWFSLINNNLLMLRLPALCCKTSI